MRHDSIVSRICIAEDARARFNSLDEVPETLNLMGMTIGRAYYESLFDFDAYTYISRYTKDVLIIHGGRDQLVDISYSERAVDAYSSAELKIIPGAGHGFNESDAVMATNYILE